MTEHSLPIEIDATFVREMIFSANGEYLITGNNRNVYVWRVKDGELVATMETRSPLVCLAVSRDGKWIVTGGYSRNTIVWDATTYKCAFHYQKNQFCAVDISPDSTRLVGSTWGGADVLNLPNCKQIQTIGNNYTIREAKYSPQGDRIATASDDSVQVWDSNNARLLVDIPVHVTSRDHNGLVWLNDHLFVVSDNTIKQFNASTGSVIAEWQVPAGNWSGHSKLALSSRGAFITYATDRAVTLWDPSTRSLLAVNDYPDGIDLIALSPDDRFLAIKKNRKISIESLPRIIVGIMSCENSIPLSRLHPTLQEPDIQVNGDVLDLWKHDHLASAEALLTRTILESSNSSHHLLAGRALVRTRLKQWDAALVDAEMAVDLQPSVIGYIAKSIAHIGQGERHKGYHACDVAFDCFHSSHGTFILLIKAIIVFMAGEHHDAISRVDDLIATVHFNWMCHIVQAYMYLLLGNSHMERNDYECAVHSFERAQAQMQHYGGQPLVVFSLISGWNFENIGIMIRQSLCEALHAAGRNKDEVKWFYQLASELGEGMNLHREHLEWASDFSQRSCKKLEHLGDAAIDAERFDEAVSYYSAALSLDPTSPQDILLKRKEAFAAIRSWELALDDANQAIKLNPSSPWGYEMKHAALHKAGEYSNAVDAFEAMLSRITQSPEQGVQQYGDQFVSPSSTRATIRKIVQRTIRHIPRVLINVNTGRLCDKTGQASAFESLPIFSNLVSSMTKRINYVHIKREVRQYFRYAMLSHRWEENEPLFQQVMDKLIFELDKSPTHDKLQTFCKIVRDAGFEWAWSDTCCINKSDNFVLQEALVAMFRWYQCAALVIVFLRGVHSSSQLGALMGSIWNTRAWTLQEYIAARVIRFYTEDWTPYLNLELSNHKESSEIISEMEKATRVSAQKLMSLRPGLTSIREKLRLASTRQTTLVEDAAYSLLGIFSVTGLPAIYGEGEGSLGRLLAHVLTVSGDVSILAWTGESGSFNSCLPAYITVFDELATSHLPPPFPDTEMEKIIAVPRPSSFDLNAALELYERLNGLHAAGFTASRMKLPCIAFQLPSLSPHRTDSGVYSADTVEFGTVEIKTRHNLSRMQHLYLVHPWLDAVLDRAAMHEGAIVEDDVTPLSDTDDEEEEFEDDEELYEEGSEGYYSATSEPESPSFPSAPAQAPTAPMDKETRARRLVARLRQPFGALLLTLAPTCRYGVDYRRVAADSRITVQIQESFPLADLLTNVRTLDVL